MKRNSHSHLKARNALGPRLKTLRLEKGLSQARLAMKLTLLGWDITPLMISRYEVGKRGLSDVELQLLLKAMKAKWAELD